MKYFIPLFIAFINCIAVYIQAPAQSKSVYEKQIAEWHNKRIQNLKSENGWLNLAGLYWLEEGKSTFGSGSPT